MVVPPRKRMKHGIPCHVVKVTKQARIVCEIRGEKIYVLHCFGSHKGYERWVQIIQIDPPTRIISDHGLSLAVFLAV